MFKALPLLVSKRHLHSKGLLPALRKRTFWNSMTAPQICACQRLWRTRIQYLQLVVRVW